MTRTQPPPLMRRFSKLKKWYWQTGKLSTALDTSDKSIPDLGEGEGELARLISKQSVEESREDEGTGQGIEGPVQECTPPPPSHDFQTARLFLTHFGFLAREHNKQEASVPPLVALDSTQTNFWRDLEALDNIGCRTCDTCHVFYVRSGQNQPEQILGNVLSESTVSAHFLEMLSSLGWPVRVNRHSGWTGHVATSWKLNSDMGDDEVERRTEKPELHGGSLYNGAAQVLYWADVSAEIAFVVPTLVQPPHYIEASDPTENSVPGAGLWSSERGPVDIKPRTMSLDLDSVASAQLRTEPAARRRADPPTPVLLVWLESFEDHFQFPSDELLGYTSTGQGGARPQDCFIIFLHALHSGLIRVKLHGAAGRMSMATPLVDGMLISRRVVGSLVRQTALNMCRRRRLDNDSYQPPHMRRRLKVQELVSKYHCDMSRSELLTFLLNAH